LEKLKRVYSENMKGDENSVVNGNEKVGENGDEM